MLFRSGSAGYTGTLQYTGANSTIFRPTQTPSVVTDRLFSLGGSGAIDSSGQYGNNVLATGAQNNAALVFGNTGNIGFSAAGSMTLTLQGNSTGDNEIDLKLTDNTDGSPLSLVKAGGGLWILGGTGNYYFGTDDDLRDDVWSSADGREWRRETAHAGWSPRAYHQAVVHGGRIYVLGGGNYTPAYHARNDVWSSADGVTWRRESSAAPWAPRLWFAAASYRGRLWVLGGWTKDPSTDWADVWTSEDGRDWERLTAGTMWKGRHEHSSFVFEDRLWVAGGHARPLSGEVWSLQVPADFFAPRKSP